MSKQKTNFTVNPETHRMIRIGGRSWLKLVKKGVIDRGDYLPPNCAYRLKEEEYENDKDKLEALENEKERIIKNKEAPIGQKPVIYKKNQIVYQSDNKITVADSARMTSDAALDIIDQIQNGDINTPTDMSRDDARNYLQGLIFSQMLSKKKKFKNTKLEPVNINRNSDSELRVTGLKQPPLPRKKVAPSVIRTRFKRPVNVRKITRIPKRRVKHEQVYMIPEQQEQSETEYEYVDVEVDDSDESEYTEEYEEYEE